MGHEAMYYENPVSTVAVFGFLPKSHWINSGNTAKVAVMPANSGMAAFDR